jgi:hypothetical protein
LWSELNHILNPASLIRIAVGTAIVSVAIIAGFKWAVPRMVLPNLWPLVLALPAIVLMLVAQCGILTLIPPTVTVRTDKILVQHGQSVTIIDSKTVTATYLTFHPDDRIRLRICYTKKSKTRSRVIGVPPTVDFNRLSEMLPMVPAVRDARNRSLTQQSPQNKAIGIGAALLRTPATPPSMRIRTRRFVSWKQALSMPSID